MFGPSLFGSFDDPFFNDMQDAHRQHMVPMEMGSMYPQQSMPSIEARGVRRPPQPFRPNPANNPMADEFMYLADTGEEMVFPPILPKGNELEITVTYMDILTRRDEKGVLHVLHVGNMYVSASCYDHSGNAVETRIVGGNSPGKGFLELRTPLENWRRVCKDGFDERKTNLLCSELTELLTILFLPELLQITVVPVGSSELGYPAVEKVSYGTGDWMSAEEDCIKAPICNVNGKNTSPSDTLNHKDGQNTSSPSDTLNHEDGKHESSPSDTLNPEDGKNTSSPSNTLNRGDGKNTSSPSNTLNPEDGKNTSSASDTLNHDGTYGKNESPPSDTSNCEGHHTRQQPVDGLLSKSGYLEPKKIFLLAFALIFIGPPCVASEVSDINITCRGDVSFTSPNYPLNYPNDADKRWFITAPKRRRILVTFTDFNIQEEEFLNLDDIMDTRNSMQYTGEEMEFPPFLTKGNKLEMTFISFTSGTRRGFNVTVSCYYHSSNAVEAHNVGGNSPVKGFLEVRTQSDDWRRVCKDGFDERVAEVVCGELGYPAVKKVSYGTGDCISAGQDCIKAPICNEYTFRLEDCLWSSGNCFSADAVKVECYEPGYKGCYDPKDLPQQNGFIFESTSQCVSSCRAITRKGLAIMNGTQCFCSIADDVNLVPNKASVADHSTCIQTTLGTRQVINSLVYDVSVGFCDELDNVIHGSRSSNIAWFGSIVRFLCDDGYSLNGSGALQCVPGLSPYYPVWNGSVPTCDMSGDGTSTSSPSTTLNPEGTPGGVSTVIGARRLYIGLGIGLGIVILTVCGVVFYCKKKGLCHMYNKSRGTRNGHGSTNAPLPDSSQSPFVPPAV